MKKEKKIIKTNLLKNYGIQINKFKNIEFNSLPVPNLVIESLLSNLNSEKALIKTERLIIYPKMLSFYNFDNFEVRKVKLINNDVVMNFQDLKSFLKIF